jgi:hypothetical protein
MKDKEGKEKQKEGDGDARRGERAQHADEEIHPINCIA